MKRMSALLAVDLAAMALAGCGESDQEKAQNQVCDARADLQQQVDDLKGLTLSADLPDQVQDALTSIGDDLTNIKNALGELSDECKQQVQTAVQSFESQMRSVAGDLGSDLSLSNAKAQLKAAATELSNGLRKAFQPVDCS
jgi:ElaB/YqjD/DUF883 family membrane-anchored ribosome-binding protein